MKLVHKCFKSIKLFKILFLSMIVLQFIDLMMNLLLPSYVGNMVDIAIPFKKDSLLFRYALTAIMLYLVSHLCTLISEFIFAKAGMELVATIKKRMLTKLYRISGEEIDRLEDKLLTIYLNDLSIIESFFCRGIPMIVSSVIFISALFIALFLQNRTLLLVQAIVILVVLSIQFSFNSLLKKASKDAITSLDKAMTQEKSILNNVSQLILLNNEEYVISNYMKTEYSYLEKSKDRLNIFNVSTTIPSFISSIGTILILVVGGYQIIQGESSIGTLLVFVFYSNRTISPIRDITNFIAGWSQAKVSLDRCEELLNTKEVL
ncbi:ABC transporter transmembrane domain-containing protein [Enterococcus phoeniculicola]|uniref:ABC transmembrane type-1 domain-containing protein n=1 Tax=Enterococcus phoeniculicola ATCC BAA-412 TaxID=1158610 RepID=R3W2C9_9ENTE|nr:ABC transporter ATP-binding protein [Enterococcus phoeniculicola]EOL41586.1 hypothetical protein UC3_03149 [Enterococcus phoeniculicola ATCC BAA-412]EOT78920.1 hypothetical protein I589_00427 [Enterococcus phoeniculicola ATCC BAA-412]